MFLQAYREGVAIRLQTAPRGSFIDLIIALLPVILDLFDNCPQNVATAVKGGKIKAGDRVRLMASIRKTTADPDGRPTFNWREAGVLADAMADECECCQSKPMGPEHGSKTWFDLVAAEVQETAA